LRSGVGNYYEDLQARFDLPTDFIARLQRASVLYDRDETGEYFHLYTAPLANRFFFEVVERRNGYRGFGAANAPIRLAAHTRSARRAAMAAD
jgi:4-hydroxyphenylpyruvate dioxygenase